MPRKKPKAQKSRAGAADYAPAPAPAQRVEVLTVFHHRDHPRLGTDRASNSLRFLLSDSFAEALATGRQIALADQFDLDVWLSAVDDPAADVLDEALFRSLFKPRRGRAKETFPIYVHSRFVRPASRCS